MRTLKPGSTKVARHPRRCAPWSRSRRMRAASASSSVVTSPPSPVVSDLRGWKLKQDMRPNVPVRRAPIAPPSEHAASQTSGTPRSARRGSSAP